MTTTRLLVYGTLKFGFPNYREDLGCPLGTYASRDPYPLIVPKDKACTNPECGFIHRMVVLLQQKGRGRPFRGQVFEVSQELLAELDAKENYSPNDIEGSTYIRGDIHVVPLDGAPELSEPVQVYFIRKACLFEHLLATGDAQAEEEYTKEMAKSERKKCCIQNPNHPRPHNINELGINAVECLPNR